MAFWSVENATKAYLNTMKMDQRSKEPDVAEFISALAAGNNSRQIVVACDGAANPTILLALIAASHQTSGQVICILRGIEELMVSKKILESKTHQIQFIVGEEHNTFSEHFREADFVVVDCNLENHEGIVQNLVHEETRSKGAKGAVIVGYNAFSKGSWRFNNGPRTQFLPIGEGLLVTRINNKTTNRISAHKANINGGNNGHLGRKSHWVVKVDKCTGEEHVFRVRVPKGKVIEA